MIGGRAVATRLRQTKKEGREVKMSSNKARNEKRKMKQTRTPITWPVKQPLTEQTDKEKAQRIKGKRRICK
jgi:hypothetical protein